MLFVIDAHPPTDRPYSGDAQWRIVSPGYFDTFRIPLLRGRLFTARDDQGAAPVALISESMDKQFWPQANPWESSSRSAANHLAPSLKSLPG